jgi:hypothetical protein
VSSRNNSTILQQCSTIEQNFPFLLIQLYPPEWTQPKSDRPRLQKRKTTLQTKDHTPASLFFTNAAVNSRWGVGRPLPVPRSRIRFPLWAVRPVREAQTPLCSLLLPLGINQPEYPA